MKRKNKDMLSGSITKGLLSMSIPIMIMNVMQSLFNIVDMTALRHFADDNAVGAVGACGMLISLCTGLLIGVATGANIIVAKRIGMGDKRQTEKAVMTSILTSIIGGLLLMFVGLAFAEIFLKMTNCPDGLLKNAVLYFRIYFLGVPVMLFYNFCASILRAIGDTKKTMYFFVLGGFLKLVFTFLFIVCLDMTVDGVAYATIISNVIVSVLVFVALMKHKDIVEINFKEIKIDISELKNILFIGIPTGLQTSLYSLANVVITSVVNSFGEAATTGISIANQFDVILSQISCAPAYATMSYVAQNLGAGNIKRVKQTVVRSIMITVSFGASLGALSAIFSGQLSSIISTNPEIIAYSRQKMVIISSTYFLSGINETMGGVLKGMGKPIYPAIVTFVFMFLLRFFWVYVIFPLNPNLTFLYAVWPIGWTMAIISLFIVYIPAIRKLQMDKGYTKENLLCQ